MDVIVLAVELHPFRLKVGANAGEEGAEVVEDVLGERFAAVFGYKDPVHMHQEDTTMSSVPNIVVVAHRP